MNLDKFLISLCLASCAGVAQADAYRCTDSAGKIVYQESRCSTGEQKAIDDSTARYRKQLQVEKLQKKEDKLQQRLELERAVSKEVDALMAQAKIDEDQLRKCISEKSCSTYGYTRGLKGRSETFVTSILGEPETVQRMGNDKIIYYTVPTSDGGKRAKLQLVFQDSGGAQVNIY